jgi:response regulator RpfG family c-di-GMP phosphodiesterase
MSPRLPKLLVVDDEPQVLQGLGRGLRGAYDLRTATSGALGLEALFLEPDIAIVMSDMRMPQMNGTEFLARARQAAPHAVRLLLTGQADMEDAIGAINEGRIFRFLKKPCAPALMKATLADAAEQHRLVIAERELLEQTLRGAVQALCDTLALANPGVFGMAMRVKRIAAGLSAKVGGTETWQVEVAAMLCQLGAMTLPPGIYERRARGEHLLPAERDMLDRVPQVTDQLLAPIPRLEAVREIVRHGRAGPATDVPMGAHVLRVALDFDELESAGLRPKSAIDELLGRPGRYHPAVLDALAALYVDVDPTRVVEVPIGRLLEGMILAADIVTKSGTLLVARGHEVTDTLIWRLVNFAGAVAAENVTVMADARLAPLRRSAA